MSFEAADYLDRLKPFQRASVEHVFSRFFDPHTPVDRYLVADEVGLGKTMVARGVIAKLIEHYAATEPDRRIDVLYVCSNQAIAKQNFSKLAIVGNRQAAVTDRITKLPIHVRELTAKLPELEMAVNFIPITPTTSLDLRSSRGRIDERALLWTMLADDRLAGARFMRRRGAEWLLQHEVSDWSWRHQKQSIKDAHLDPTLLGAFVRDMTAGSESLLAKFMDLAEQSTDRRARQDWNHQHKRNKMLGTLRRQLSETCIGALEPDLIILDEFQRFPKLMDLNSPVGELADLLFRQEGAKTLLLSATPYKMLTRRTELDEDHHGEFLKTTSFLLGHDTDATERVTAALADYREGLRALAGEDPDIDALSAARDAIATELRRVMCRTERLGATGDRNGMLDAKPANEIRPRLLPGDLVQFRELDRIASALRTSDMVEYWKSVPFPLNFMDGYELAKDFEKGLASGKVEAIVHGLDAAGVRDMRAIDLGNARLRGVVDRLDEEKSWSLLWLPPSLQYYGSGRPFDTATVTTKRLIFSAWTVVPKAIASLVSYEAERRLFASMPGRRRPETQALGWRAEGPMTELVLSMPSIALAELVDPLLLAREHEHAGDLMSHAEAVRTARKAIDEALGALPEPSGGVEDARWYLAAPLLLDKQHDFDRPPATLDAIGEVSVETKVLGQHVKQLRRLVDDPSRLGRRPADLAAVLTNVAVGGPGVCALRALRRARASSPATDQFGPALELGLAFRDLFNLPEAYAIIRSLSGTAKADEVFWKAALEYCVSGNLQAVLDEYVHALSDWVEDLPAEQGGKVAAVVKTAVDSLSIKTTDLTARTVEKGAIGEPVRMRTRFALRLGDGRTEDAKSVNRVDTVRKAFNSPFWPFVLVTTSIGQEGLDFHHYSHAVLHWNLPSNPVDLEQREGRVHRFKNHAVRRNIAAAQRAHGLAAADPWSAMFAAVPQADEGLQPFWIYEGDARIERHALTLPMSRDADRLVDLTTLLGIYRLAFGQPRQDELLDALRRTPEIAARLDDLLINLQPASVSEPSP